MPQRGYVTVHGKRNPQVNVKTRQCDPWVLKRLNQMHLVSSPPSFVLNLQHPFVGSKCLKASPTVAKMVGRRAKAQRSQSHRNRSSLPLSPTSYQPFHRAPSLMLKWKSYGPDKKRGGGKKKNPKNCSARESFHHFHLSGGTSRGSDYINHPPHLKFRDYEVAAPADNLFCLYTNKA